uniref:General transcription factor 3C polypeptide 3 n=1 Tax=Romanomermis culicivorax TaxID=13658 RepID=A0A915J004_ROMCU
MDDDVHRQPINDSECFDTEKNMLIDETHLISNARYTDRKSKADRPTCSSYSDHVNRKSSKSSKSVSFTNVRPQKKFGVELKNYDDVGMNEISSLLDDETTANMIEKLKQAYDAVPVVFDSNKMKTIGDGTKPDEKDERNFLNEGDSEESEDESDEDYIPPESVKKVSTTTNRKAQKSNIKNNTSSVDSKLKKKSLALKFEEFRSVDNDDDVDDPTNYDWSALARMNDAKLSDDSEVDSDDQDEDAANISTSQSPKKSSGGGRRFSKKALPCELSSLLGQATVYFAQDRIEEAIQMCREVIRQKPSHSESYAILGSFYEKMGDMDKYLQFSLLSAHLDRSCPGDRWAFLGQMAEEQKRYDQACVAYAKAFSIDPNADEYYEKQIGLINQLYKDSPEILRRKLMYAKFNAAQQMVKNTKLTTDSYLTFARSVFQELFAEGKVHKAIICLHCCLEKAKADQKVLYAELNHYVELNMQRKKYDVALNAILTYSTIRHTTKKEDFIDMNEDLHMRVGKRTVLNATSLIVLESSSFIMPKDFPVDILTKTICCLIHENRLELAKPLLAHFDGYHKHITTVDLFLDVSDALTSKYFYENAEQLLTSLINTENLATAAVWLCYADTLSALGRLESACKAYSNVVELCPEHVNARLSLSALQHQLGLSEEALKTLEVADSDQLLEWDSRLLYQKCALVEQQGDRKSHFQCARQLLALCFKTYDDHNSYYSVSRSPNSKLSLAFRTVLLKELHGSQWEKLIRKVPNLEDKKFDLKSEEIWSIFKKVYDYYASSNRYTEMLHVSSLAYLCTKLVYSGIGYVDYIMGYILFATLKARRFSVFFHLLRWHSFPRKNVAFMNLIGLIGTSCNDRNFCRWILRQAILEPGDVGFSWLTGNNSVSSGLYQHTIAEYASIYDQNSEHPLLNLLMGISYVNLSCKKDIVRRHDLCIQGLYFLQKYEKLRGPCQETYYNLGRAMQQTGLTYAAVFYYKKALEMDPALPKSKLSSNDDNIYDLKRIIAHNLILIYVNCQNVDLARMYMEKYCVI